MQFSLSSWGVATVIVLELFQSFVFPSSTYNSASATANDHRTPSPPTERPETSIMGHQGSSNSSISSNSTASSSSSSSSNNNNNVNIAGGRKQLVYFVRHAEATHNIKEREAVERAVAAGILSTDDQEQVRRSVLNDMELWDAPLSDSGRLQVRQELVDLMLLHTVGVAKYPAPRVVLTSPLRRALMTAMELFREVHPPPRFVALEILREKRTGFAADECSPVEVLEEEFPHVDFSDLKKPDRLHIEKGEDNAKVRARTRVFLEETLARMEESDIAVISHKGWLRELRETLKHMVEDGSLNVDFDIDHWHKTLYGNAEIRVVECHWRDQRLATIVSRSVRNALRSIVENSMGLPCLLSERDFTV